VANQTKEETNSERRNELKEKDKVRSRDTGGDMM